MLTIPLITTAGDILGVLQIINALDDNNEVIPFTQDDEKIMHHFASVAAIAIVRAKLTRSIVLRMIKMTEFHDPKETGAHIYRVGNYSIDIYEKWARRRNLPLGEIDRNRDILKMAAMLHDVGKIAISDVILKKPSPLTDEEFEIMKQHSILGTRLLLDKQSEFDEVAAVVTLNHHERWDGGSRGYPGHVEVETGEAIEGMTLSNGDPLPKKGEEIPIFGRIVALADAYDALSSYRCYKEPFEEEKVLEIIKDESGKQFDPELVEILLEISDTIKSIKDRHAEVSIIE